MDTKCRRLSDDVALWHLADLLTVHLIVCFRGQPDIAKEIGHFRY
jgi:hypothetical protein